MRASEFEIGLVKFEEEGYKPYWKGYLIYKGAPVFEVIGNQASGQYGDFIPLNFVEEEGTIRDPEQKEADIGLINIKPIEKQNGGGYNFSFKGTASLFDKTITMPIAGWLALREHDGKTVKAVRLSLDNSYLEYMDTDKYFEGLAKSGKPMPIFKLENNLDYTVEDLELLKSSYPEFEDFYKNYICSQKSKKVVSTKKFMLPKTIPTMAQAVEKAKVTSGVAPNLKVDDAHQPSDMPQY